MQKIVVALACTAAVFTGSVAARAQQPVKVGLINVLSGQFADAGIQLDNGIKTYMKQHGDTVAGKKIEIIRRDVGGPNPDVAKRHAQELIVRDKVDLLAGFLLTPNALAAGDVSAEAKKFMVVMNAATSIMAKSGIKKCYTMVTDYGPGHDSEAAFQRAFKDAGGEIVGSVGSRSPIRISPLLSSAPKTSIRSASTFSYPAALSRPLSARPWPSAGSISTRRRFSARAKPPPSRRSRPWEMQAWA